MHIKREAYSPLLADLHVLHGLAVALSALQHHKCKGSSNPLSKASKAKGGHKRRQG
jgi:hypothetical protein